MSVKLEKYHRCNRILDWLYACPWYPTAKKYKPQSASFIMTDKDSMRYLYLSTATVSMIGPKYWYNKPLSRKEAPHE